MTVLSSPNIYDRAIAGEPLPHIVRSCSLLETSPRLWTVDDWQIWIPEPRISPAPAVQRIVSEIRDQTGWSARRLAEVVGTSHTTILRIESGRRLVSGHSGDLRRRLSQAYDLVSRIYIVADRDPAATARLLEETPLSGRSAVDLLRGDEPARAYLAAIDVARPRPPGLLVGIRPRAGDATAALHE